MGPIIFVGAVDGNRSALVDVEGAPFGNCITMSFYLICFTMEMRNPDGDSMTADLELLTS